MYRQYHMQYIPVYIQYTAVYTNRIPLMQRGVSRADAETTDEMPDAMRCEATWTMAHGIGIRKELRYSSTPGYATRPRPLAGTTDYRVHR